MREFLLLILTSVLTLAAVAKPQFGVLAYIWFGLMRPDFIAYSTGQYNYSLMLAVGMILGSWREIGQIRAAWFTNPISWMMVLLQVPILISTQTAVFPSYSWDQYLLFLKMSVAVLWIPVLIYDLSHMRLLFLVTALSLGAHAVWQSIGGVLLGGSASTNGIGGFMSDNNTFAAGLVMVFPFCWYSRYLVQQIWLKVILTVMAASILFTIVLTHSRGGALAAATVLLVLLLQTKRRLLVFLGLLIALLPGLYLVRGTYFQRLGTMQNYEEDYSAMSRIIQNKVALQVWASNPFTGVGIGERNYFTASTSYLEEMGEDDREGLVVHNSYLQMLAHCGIFALLLQLCLFICGAWMMWRSSRRLSLTHPGLECYPRAIELSIIGYLIASLTQPRATFDFAYTVAMYAAAWYAIEKRLPAQAKPTQVAALPVPAAASVEDAYTGITPMLGRLGPRRR